MQQRLNITKKKSKVPKVFINVEYQRLLVVNGIYNQYKHLIPPKINSNATFMHEWTNIISRFLLTMSNYKPNLQPRKDPVLVNVATDHSIYKKLSDEIIEKKMYNRNKISMIIIKIKEMIEKFIRSIKYYQTQKFVPVYDKESNIFSYGDYTKQIPIIKANILFKILKQNGVNPTEHVKLITQMLIRYDSLLPSGLQMGMHPSIYKRFNELYGFDCEGFASPINSIMIKVNPKNKFCSLFKDTDHYFNSMGSFFDLANEANNVNNVMTEGNIIVHPPFTEEIIDKSGNHTLKMIENAEKQNKKLRCMFISTYWKDMPIFDSIIKSKYCKFHNEYKKNTFAVEISYKDSDKNLFIKGNYVLFIAVLESYPSDTDFSAIDSVVYASVNNGVFENDI